MKQGYIHSTYREDSMSHQSDPKRPAEPKVTIEEVNRVLEVGSLLFSVLTEEEKAELISMLSSSQSENEIDTM